MTVTVYCWRLTWVLLLGIVPGTVSESLNGEALTVGVGLAVWGGGAENCGNFFDYLVLKWRVLISSILTYVFLARDIHLIYALCAICCRLSVCPSVRRVYHKKTVEVRIMKFSPYGSSTI